MALDIDFDKPVVGNAHDTDLDAIRDNTIWAVVVRAVDGQSIPGWAATPSGADLSKPDDVILTGPGGRKIRLTLSYTVDSVTGIVVDYDDNQGGGYVTLVTGTATITYNGAGEWTGTTWA